jgi:excisionase family DNA binding protein
MSARLLYDKPEAAAQLSISERVLERLIKDGDLDTVQIGRRRLVPAEALVAYVERIKAAS